MMRDSMLDGIEYACVACGHRSYGEGFEALDRPLDGTREARHDGARL